MSDQKNGHDKVTELRKRKDPTAKEITEGAATHDQKLADMQTQMAEREAQIRANITAVGENLQMVVNQVADFLQAAMANAEADYKSGHPNRIIAAEEAFARFEKGLPQSWCDIANMNLRQGMANLRRALDCPTEF